MSVASSKPLRLALLVAALLLVTACAGRTDWPRDDHLDGDPRPQFRHLEVPFHAQEKYQCGPASLAMMLNAQSLEATPEELVDRVYLPERGGTLQVELVSAARERGLLVYPLNPDLEALLDEVAAGEPVLVMQNLRFSWWPQWHYAVVVGYDERREELILHSGVEENYRQSLGLFERTWARADRWAVTMTPPDQIPVSAEPLRFLGSASDLESTGRLAPAHQAYAAALARWPEQPAARFGLGNTAYALGEPWTAIQHYLALVEAHPGLPGAWNNLGVALAEQGCEATGYRARLCAARLDEERFAPAPADTLDEGGYCPVLSCSH